MGSLRTTAKQRRDIVFWALIVTLGLVAVWVWVDALRPRLDSAAAVGLCSCLRLRGSTLY
jgi:hypothetical protein